jgi:ABC-2 type transport system ATP-binding protein
MSAGRLVAQGTVEDFRRSGGGSRVEVRTPDGPAARRVLARLGIAVEEDHGASDRDIVSGMLPGQPDSEGGAPDATGAPTPEAIVAALVADGVRVRGFAVERASLEQRFVELTGEGFDVVG